MDQHGLATNRIGWWLVLASGSWAAVILAVRLALR